MLGLISSLHWFNSSGALGYALWAGLALLTLSLLVLMWTRWGLVKPLQKCVWLSLLAHLLLAMYAYSAQLIFETNPSSANRVVKLNLVTADDSVTEQIAHEPADKPWEKFPGLDKTAPEAIALKPHELDAGDSLAQQVAEPNLTDGLTPPETAPLDVAGIENNQSTEELQSILAESGRSLPVSNHDFFRLPHQTTPTEMESQFLERSKPSTRRETQELLPLAHPIERQHALTGNELNITPPAMANKNEAFHSNLHTTQSINTQTLTDPAERTLDSLTDPRSEIPDLAKAPWLADSISKNNLSVNTNQTQRNTDWNPPQATGVLLSQAWIPRRRLVDGKVLPSTYNLRLSPQQKAIALQNGGSEKTEQAVQLSLQWLARSQSADGRWEAAKWGGDREELVDGQNRNNAGIGADTGITGLALLAFLAGGKTHVDGEYQETVSRGLHFLKQQQHSDGSLAGQARLFAAMYCHGIALLALSEAYALTGDPNLRDAVIRGAEFSLKSQNQSTGGWRYRAGDEGDMSQFGWQVMALRSAELSGIQIPEEAKTKMKAFLLANSSGEYGGLARYNASKDVSRAMTAEALCCRVFLGMPLKPEQVHEATAYILQDLPGGRKADFYYWYYATLALYQVGGESWDKWSPMLNGKLVQLQRQHDDLAGSWDHDSVWGGYGGRVYTTALASLCLQTYYRYLPCLRVDPTRSTGNPSPSPLKVR